MIYKKYQIGLSQKFRRQKLCASAKRIRSIQLCILCNSNKCDTNKSGCCDFSWYTANNACTSLVYVFDEEI